MPVACVRDPMTPKLLGWWPWRARKPHPVLACSAVRCAYVLCHTFCTQLSTRCLCPRLWDPLRGRSPDLRFAAGLAESGTCYGGWHGSGGSSHRTCGCEAPSRGDGARTELNRGAAWSPRTQTQRGQRACAVPGQAGSPGDTSSLHFPVRAGGGHGTGARSPASPCAPPAPWPHSAACWQSQHRALPLRRCLLHRAPRSLGPAVPCPLRLVPETLTGVLAPGPSSAGSHLSPVCFHRTVRRCRNNPIRPCV